jgi:hypothetical protein
MLTDDMTRILTDPAASDWLKHSMIDALSRDPIDAANDAEILCSLLASRAEAVLHQDMTNVVYFDRGALTE